VLLLRWLILVLVQIKVDFAKTINDPSLPRAWSHHAQEKQEDESIRKKPISQIQAEDKKKSRTKNRKFTEFLAVMMKNKRRIME
jgi:hypothetical protein